VAAEEDHVARVEDRGALPARVFRGDVGELVARLVGLVGARDRLDVGEEEIAAVACGRVGVRVDRLVLAAGRDPQAPVLGVGPVERDPRPDERVGLVMMWKESW
jgi:hypothetical protein